MDNQWQQPTTQEITVLVKILLTPLAIKSRENANDFENALKEEMFEDLEYVQSLEKVVDELESEKAEFLNEYDLLLQECVSKDIMCSILCSFESLDEKTELQYTRNFGLIFGARNGRDLQTTAKTLKDLCSQERAGDNVHSYIYTSDAVTNSSSAGITSFHDGVSPYRLKLAGDGIAGIKRRRRDQSSHGVRNMVTTSGRGRLKEDLESSTWRRRNASKTHASVA
ncbi:hypothetical protein Tco_0509623, partial [Tanacetum coccineum]